MIYFDNSATTEISPEVAGAITASISNFHNPSSLYEPSVLKKREISSVALKIRKKLGAKSGNIIFTSGGTEANNLILHSAIKKLRGGNMIVSSVEHSSIIETAKHYQNQGFDVRIQNPKDILSSIDDKTRFISLMQVNNETGEIFDIDSIAMKAKALNSDIFFHSDIVAAFSKLPLNLRCIDALTLTGHKIHAPKGIGALYIKNKSYITPLIMGGGQNEGLRGGTEPTILIDALGCAVEMAKPLDCAELKKAIIDEFSSDDRVLITKVDNAVDYILSLSVRKMPSEVLLHAFEQEGIYLSSGSACKGGEKSHVLAAMGLSPDIVNGALRISFSKYSSIEEVKKFNEVFKKILARFVKR